MPDENMEQYSYRIDRATLTELRHYLIDHRGEYASLKAILDDAVAEWMERRDFKPRE